MKVKQDYTLGFSSTIQRVRLTWLRSVKSLVKQWCFGSQTIKTNGGPGSLGGSMGPVRGCWDEQNMNHEHEHRSTLS